MNHEEFVDYSKKLVADYTGGIEASDVYVVWSAKVLQNSKLLLSTPVSDGMYYEVTLNGDKQEIYFDAYKKQENECIELNTEDE